MRRAIIALATCALFLASFTSLFCLSAYAQSQVEVATTVAFLEGSASDRLGNVYFSDILNQRILKLSSDGMLSVYRERSNVANGLLIDPQGRLIAARAATSSVRASS